ncbi:MAG TPA: glycosyltransferase family 39 protein [Candidatus Acidoferrales bacterium]|nr:glycosyltransferase family 39 protein [Candidatus Acidoferrales bacterium]
MPSAIPSTLNARRELPLVWAVLAAAALLRLTDALRRPLQVDEAYSLHLGALPLEQGLRAVAALDVHPPLFLLLVHGLTSWHLPDWGFRIGAAALGVLSVWLFYQVVRLWHGEQAALLASALTAFLPALIFYDTMIRMYALFDALVLGGFWALSILYTRDDLSAGARRVLWFAWTALAAASIWTLYLGFLVIAAQLLYAALVKRDALVKTVAGAAAAIALWSAQLHTFAAQLPRGGIAFPLFAQHQLATVLAIPGQATIAPQTLGAGVLTLVATIFGLVWLALALLGGLGGNTRSLALWIGVPSVLTLAYSLAAHKLLYADRYFLLAAYALCGLTALALARVWAKNGSAARIAGGVLCTLVVAAGCAYAVEPDLYTADWPAVGAVLQANLHEGDLVILEQGSGFFPLERGPWLDHHPLVLVFHRDDAPAALGLARAYPRVFCVIFQAGPVDPSLSLLRGLRDTRQLIYVWEFVRWLPAESASVLVFERRPARR